MSRDEFMEVVSFLQKSDTLKDMQLTGFEDNEKTGFRAFTLTAPKGDTNPVMVFRGTAADGQWDDNLAMFISSQAS